MKRLKNFIVALCQHILFGMKKNSPEEILRRYSICSVCDMCSPDKNQCLECGCYISKQKKFLNKLAWADQKCPLNKW